MCGIVAQYGNPDPRLGERMLARIAHRGPDGEGVHRAGRTWLGHRRLSIVDIEGGGQPLTHPGGSVLVGNGEIYNHAALRESLPTRGYGSRSDNEVVLHSVAEHGGDRLADLRGMYAVVVAGSQPGQFLAARDPVGIKPLYWSQAGDTVLFASEMKAFDRQHRAHVRPFPPGTYWTPGTGLVRFATAVPGTRVPTVAESPERVATILREALVRSVHAHMMGDVPVGVLLSGGLDSSLVAAIATRWCARRGQRLRTFAVGTADSADLQAAREVADHLGTEHHEHIYTAEEAVAVVPEVVRVVEHFDPALLHSSVANYLVARLAARHIKVVLTGEGADELFAGYAYLDRFPDLADLDAELHRTVRTLHSLNLQRCDRTTMAFGLEARVPFLDVDFIELALRVPIALRRPEFGGQEKYLLRAAFAGWLPEHLLWRRKAQFGDGSGMSAVLRARISATVSDTDYRSAPAPVRNREELAYHQVWTSNLGGIPTAALEASQTL